MAPCASAGAEEAVDEVADRFEMVALIGEGPARLGAAARGQGAPCAPRLSLAHWAGRGASGRRKAIGSGAAALWHGQRARAALQR